MEPEHRMSNACSGMTGVLYIAGSWEVMMGERWFVWTYDPKSGWERLSWQKKSEKHGFRDDPRGT